MTHTKAAEVAQTLGNEMTIVFSAAQMAMAELPLGHPVRQWIADISGAAQRVTWLASALVNEAAAEAAADSAIQDAVQMGGVATLLSPEAAERLLRDLFPGRRG